MIVIRTRKATVPKPDVVGDRTYRAPYRLTAGTAKGSVCMAAAVDHTPL